MWNAVNHIESWLTLAAFGIAAVVTVLRRRLLSRERQLKSIPANDRAAALQALNNAFLVPSLPINPSSLSQDQQFQLLLQQMQARSRRFYVISIIVLIFGVVMAIAMVRVWLLPASKQPIGSALPYGGQQPSHPIRTSVAVVTVKNNAAPDAANLVPEISTVLESALRAGEDVRVVTGEEISQVKRDLAIAEDDRSPLNLRRIQRILHVSRLVVGSYTSAGEPDSHVFRLDVELIDAESLAVITTSFVTFTERSLTAAILQVTAEFRYKEGMTALSSDSAVEAEASLPSSREAARLYARGIAKLRDLDAKEARDLLIKAAVKEPRHALTHAALSTAHSELGYAKLALEEAQQAIDHAGDRAGPEQSLLFQEQKLQVEARFAEAAEKWSDAAAVEQRLWKSFPDNPDYGIRLANAQISAQKVTEALATIAALRKRPFPFSEDGRIDLAESRAWQERSDFVKQKKFASAAATKGRAIGARSLVAHARLLEATALFALGDIKEMNAAIDEAQTLFADIGDHSNEARAIEVTASTLDGLDYDAERRVLLKALEIHKSLGDQFGTARVLLNIGTALTWQDRIAEASPLFTEALQTFGHVGADYAKAVALNQIGALWFNRGDLVNAKRNYEEAFSIFRRLSENTEIATTLTNIAEVLQCEGELDQASEKDKEAMALDQAARKPSNIAYDFFRAGEILAIHDEIPVARNRYQKALKLQEAISEEIPAADTRVALARLDIEEGRPGEAEKSAKAAEQILREGGAADRSLWTLAVLADAFLKQGKQSEASEVMSRALPLAAQTKNRRIRLEVMIVAARVRAATKKPEDVVAALQSLAAIRVEASRWLFVISELEAELAAGEIEVAAGRSGAKERLLALEREARAKGFLLIARHAAVAASSVSAAPRGGGRSIEVRAHRWDRGRRARFRSTAFVC